MIHNRTQNKRKSSPDLDPVFGAAPVLACVEGALEEAQEGCQAEAVHVVDLGQVTDHEVQGTAVLCQRQVDVPLLATRCIG